MSPHVCLYSDRAATGGRYQSARAANSADRIRPVDRVRVPRHARGPSWVRESLRATRSHWPGTSLCPDVHFAALRSTRDGSRGYTWFHRHAACPRRVGVNSGPAIGAQSHSWRSMGASPSVVSVPRATLITRGRPNSSNTSTMKVWPYRCRSRRRTGDAVR